MTDLIGQHLDGRYKIIAEIGEGGMATVYKALDTRLENEVAVKVIRIERLAPEVLGRALKRFEREAKSLAHLTHPNIVKVVDYGQYGESPYLVMEYLPGGSLKAKMGKSFPWREAACLVAPIAEALAYAHEQNIIHRDVKPSNILLTEKGQPMLADFGIAKIIDEEATVDLTGTKATIGTPEYMSPEQGLGKSIDSRSDIYSLGIIVYELITGRKPFYADTPMEMVFKHVSEPLPRPSIYVPNLPQLVEQMLIKALSKKPEARYQTMAEFATALRELASGQIVPKKGQRFPKTKLTSPSPEKSGRSTKPHWAPWLAGAGIIILAACIGLVALFTSLTNRDTPLPMTDGASSPRPTSTLRKPTASLSWQATSTPRPSTTSPSAKYAYISVSNAYLYQGPGLDFYPASSDPYSNGSKFTVLARSSDNNWLLCKAQDGTVGWLYKDWLDVSFSISSVSVAATIPAPPPTPTRRPRSGRR